MGEGMSAVRRRHEGPAPACATKGNRLSSGNHFDLIITDYEMPRV